MKANVSIVIYCNYKTCASKYTQSAWKFYQNNALCPLEQDLFSLYNADPSSYIYIQDHKIYVERLKKIGACINMNMQTLGKQLNHWFLAKLSVNVSTTTSSSTF